MRDVCIPRHRLKTMELSDEVFHFTSTWFRYMNSGDGGIDKVFDGLHLTATSNDLSGCFIRNLRIGEHCVRG